MNLLYWRFLLIIPICLMNDDYVLGQSMQTINVMYVNEELNTVADRGLEAALLYVSKTPQLGVKIELQRVVGNRTDTKGMLAALCTTYTKLVDENTPPHVVLDVTMSGFASETVKSFTAALAIPTITASFGQDGDLRLWRNIKDEQKNYLVQIMPPADIIPEIIRTIVEKQKIANAAILFDDSFVMDHKYKSLLQNIPTRHVITQIDEPNKIKEQLKRLRNLDIVNFFVLGSLTSIKNVLDGADEINFFGKKFAWYAITQNKGDLKSNCKNATIIYVKPTPDAKSQDRLGNIKTSFQLNAEPEIAAAFYFDLALRTFLTVKDMIIDGLWPKNLTYISCDDYDGHNSPPRYGLDLRKAFKKIPTYGPINVTTNGQSQMEFNMQLAAVSIRDGASDKSELLGTWKAGLNNELNLVEENAMSNYTADIIYRVVTVLQKPFIMVDENAPKKYSGYCIDLIDKIAEILRFDYEIYTAPDGKFGNMDEGGYWNGVVRELMDKKADIGLGSMSVMAERENVIDFTVPYYDLVGITILMKKPKAPTSLFKFLTVLENEVWLCILAAYFFTSFLMWVFDRWSPYSYQNNREKYKDDEEKREFNLKECLWFCMTSLTPQGGGEAPKNLSGRLVAATWWLFGFIIIASYTANLAAFLTVSRLDTPVESLDDLSKQYKIQYAPLNGSSAMTYFERMANIEAKFYEIWKDMSLNDSLSAVERSKLAVWDYPVSDKYTKMWQAMKEAGLPNTLEEAVARVLKSQSSSDGFAYLGDATDIRYLQLTDCDLQMIGEEFSRKPYAVAVQQGSPLKDQFNTAILTLLNKRELEKLKEKWWNSNPEAKNCIKKDDQSDGISIENIGGVFIVIFVGVGLACITLAFEYWWYKYRKGSSKIVDVREANSGPTKVSNIQQTKRGVDPDMNVGFRPRQVYPPQAAATTTNYRARF
ncbi:ionotropic receptor 25a-like isoform X2 [Chrysoperla carnea]|uniref:ionotropic receptor 25a-like isoform X2 n=1 Tax=Chrysoperla carnea TaxID=189513 RepID=UPI001D094A21|nr:ionotropic receptor 25a-like isoform X2 [Chrysoperla carnea]